MQYKHPSLSVASAIFTYDHWHEIRVICGLDNIRGVKEFVEGGRQEEEKTHNEQHIHGYKLNHMDLDFCDGRAVKHGFQDMHPIFRKLHSG